MVYEDFKAASASEKIGLCILEGARRLVGWTVYSGSVYSIPFSESNVLVSVEDDEVVVSEVFSIAQVIAGTYYFDRDNDLIYVRLVDSTDPDDSFMAVVFRYFFSNTGVKAPHDLSTGFDVYWQPILQTLSDFKLEVDNRDTQLGLAIEGSGTIRFINDPNFWPEKYDKVFFDNQMIYVYSWERTLPITEAQILFRGRVQNKTYSTETVQIQAKDVLNQLRDSFNLGFIEDINFDAVWLNGTISPRVNDDQLEAKPRLIYGKAFGVVATSIEQVLPDTPARRISFETGFPRYNGGNVTPTNGSKSVTISSAFRTNEIMPGDQVLFENDLENLYTVDSFSGVTGPFTLTENFTGTTGSQEIRIFPARQRRHHNRTFLVAGHPLSETSTVVQQVIDGQHFYVADASELLVGDNIIVNASGTNYDRIIESITDTNLITTTVLISPAPAIGESVKRPGVQKVYLNNQLLIQGQDYTVDSSAALIYLDSTNPTTGFGNPEFNHTKTQQFSGRVTFTNDSNVVTKSATVHSGGQVTAFTTQFRPGDYIQQPDGLWREIWYVLDDSLMVLAGLASFTGPSPIDSENGLRKYVEYYQEGRDLLICDVRGKTDDGTTTGNWIRTAPDIVKNILEDYELGTVDSASFETASGQVPFDVSLVLPENVGDKKSPSLRDAISILNRSIFGTLLQNSDLDLAYAVISADKAPLVTFDRSDVVDFGINSDSSKIVKNSIVIYDQQEKDYQTLNRSTKTVIQTSELVQKLIKVARDFTVETRLVDENAATVMAGRWSFLLELATSRLTAQMKMQGSQLSVGDPVQVNHPKLYERFGSNIKRRLGSVSLISRGMTKSTMTIDDLSNAFTRVATIAEDDSADYADATDAEQVVSGYITEDNGLLGTDPETYGLNVIW